MKKSHIQISLSVFIAVLIALFLIINNAGEFIGQRFIKKYNNSEDAKYIISIDKINLHILSGSVKLKNIEVLPKDSLMFLGGYYHGEPVGNTSFKISIEEVKLNGFDIIDAFSNRLISANKFIIDNPNIEIFHHYKEKQIEEQPQDTIDIKRIFLLNYDSLKLGEMTINNISSTLHTIDSINDTLTTFNISNLSYQLLKVKANRHTLYSKSLFVFEEFILDSKNIKVQLEDLAKITVNSIHFNSSDKDLEINDIKFTPTTSPDEYLSRLTYKKGWVKFSAKKINISQFDNEKWFDSQAIYAKNLTVVDPYLTIHTKQGLLNKPNVKKPMLGQMITEIPLPFFIENASIKNTTISLDIDGKMTPTHGKLEFNNMDVEIQNITNIPLEIDKNEIANIDIATQINHSGNINANLKVNLNSNSSITLFTLNASHLNFKKFNTILKPIVRVSLLDGEMVQLKVNSTLSNNGAFGTMDAHYRNLKLQLEPKDIHEKPGLLSNMASGLANGIIKSNNIPNTPYYHQAEFQIKKMDHDNFFKLLWLVTLNGLENTILGTDIKKNKKKRKRKKN